MTDRLSWALVGLAGALVVGVLFAVGADLERAGSVGPRWKRSLVNAGLILLASLGLLSPGYGAGLGQETAAQSQGDAMTQTAEWKRISEIWREAEGVVSGKQMPRPYDQAKQKSLLDRLNAAQADVDALKAANQLSAPEADLFKMDLDLLRAAVQSKRPEEPRVTQKDDNMPPMTCYAPMRVDPPAQESTQRLHNRMGLLESLAESQTLHPQVVGKIVAQIQKDVAVLQDERQLNSLTEEERAVARGVRDRASALSSKLQKRLGRNPAE